MDAYNPRHWTDHLFDIRGTMAREILLRVSVCVAWTAILTLALLLVLRPHSSHERFSEGRKPRGG